MFKSKTYIVYLAVFLAFVGSVGVYARSASLLDTATLEHFLGPQDLWRVVNYLCVPSARLGKPFPCAEVHLGDHGAAGWATLRVGSAHILTVPTQPVSGIESPEVQSGASAYYWQAAWDARALVEADVGHKLPRDVIGLAINSAYARTQDQFHIHTSCVQPAVRAALASEGSRIGAQWTRLRTPLRGVNYMARRLDGANLSDRNIVDLLPDPVKSDVAAMARQTLVLIGATFDGGTDGYYLLNTQASRSRIGDGEKLLDFGCR